MTARKCQAPRVAIIILNYNSWQDTSRCLRSLEMLDYPRPDILLVDNGSTDDSVARLQESFDVPILRQDRNRGFAAAGNVAITKAFANGTDYLWLLNNDTDVSPDSLREMVALARSDDAVGAVGCPIRDFTDRNRLLAWGGGHVSFVLGVSRHCRRPTPPRRLDYLTGTSLLLRVSALRQSGLMDEGYFMYWEDVDLCVRLRRAGWKLAVARRAAVYHKEAAAFQGDLGRRDALATASAVRFFRKYAPLPIVPILLGAALRSGLRVLRLQPLRAITIWTSTIRALWNGRGGAKS